MNRLAFLTPRSADRDMPLILGPLQWLVPLFDRLFGWCSRAGTTPFLDPADFPWTSQMERAWPAIRAELDDLIAAVSVPAFEDISPAERILSTDGRWKTFFLTAYGHEVEANIRRCPATWQAVRQIPGLISACFSILEAGKELPVHRGLNRGVIRYHLAVRIPGGKSGCALTVAGETRCWVEGQSLIFDDTYRHSAYNRTRRVRVVLFADVERPMHFPANFLHRLLVRAVGRSVYMRNSKALLAQFEARVAGAGP